MAKVWNFHGASYYECDLCTNPTNRVLTDSHTNKEICFDCASYGEHGLFYTVTQEPEQDKDNLIEEAIKAELLPYKLVGQCVYCKMELRDDGIALFDTIGGDSCGVPLDNGINDHQHCNGFAPDTWGSDPDMCSTCFAHEKDHPASSNEGK